MVADIIEEGLSLAVLFQLEDIQSLCSFLALWSPRMLNSYVEFGDNQSVLVTTK